MRALRKSCVLALYAYEKRACALSVARVTSTRANGNIARLIKSARAVSVRSCACKEYMYVLIAGPSGCTCTC